MSRYELIMLVCAIAAMGCGSCNPVAASTDFARALSAARWMVRDVAAESTLMPMDAQGRVGRLKLKLERRDEPGGQVWKSSCTVTSETPADRAVTLSLVIPIAAPGGVWWDDPQRSRAISGKKAFSSFVDVGVGATGSCSRYPLAVVSVGDRALCVAVPIEPQRLVSFVYDPAKQELRAEFDFGLSSVPSHFPSRADATVIAFEVPAKWAFRQALVRYYELYPEAFQRRVVKTGIWLPFEPVTVVDRPQDFGIMFHELHPDQLAWAKDDEKQGVDTYIYVEPQTYWRVFRGDGERPYASWVAQLWEDALKGDEKARATLTSGIEHADGRRDVYLDPVAYTTMAPFGVNPDPEVPTDEWGAWPNKATFEMRALSKMLGWTDGKPTEIDGVYIDSMEAWCEIKNYNRSHWRVARFPLTFDASRKVCLLNLWGSIAFARTVSEKLHSKGQCLMGNDVAFRFWQLAEYVDIPGREYTWIENGEWTPVPDEKYLFFRSMCGRKPYLMLMNNAFEDGSHMEDYFQRNLFYGVYPSMYRANARAGEVPYFHNPEWYNRDRPLFLKYIPMIRKLDMAGWQPVPYANARPESVRIERYGSFAKGSLAFTLHNTGAQPQKVELVPSRQDLRLPEKVSAREWISGKQVAVEAKGDPIVRLDMAPGGYAVVEIGP